MKIRTDFVTNSSSSSFTVEVSIFHENGRVAIKEVPYDNGGSVEALFTGDLRDINDHLSSVRDLATWLADSVKEEHFCEMESSRFKSKKRAFVENALKEIHSVKDVTSIVVERKYYAWGEFADLIADNDDEIYEIAQRYVRSNGIEKERAEAEMITHILTATEARGENFGSSSRVNLYNWDGKSLKEFALRIISNKGPGDVSGTERIELNLRTGEYFNTSSFDIK